jgi:hypothetical protein
MFDYLLTSYLINYTVATSPNPILRSNICLKTGLTNRVYDMLREKKRISELATTQALRSFLETPRKALANSETLFPTRDLA